ncbi:MAG: thiamine phosphate synthase [Flavobacteriales bacterium]|nr:thiamine phosphate synthase [Flavobacteriales bacterium]MBT4705306.1 thiamine phosphate synthase [Flavobacteriales bacterium]MBT4930868.1 thiamine phosphate synthase [Flavobacteriales bacterium]MBT5132794.1 thiamine phosphate synthase [Flavobacteriales bacterium]MBT6382784.1 thiamine phosphate synthase [Flavobacteriales bacterium]
MDVILVTSSEESNSELTRVLELFKQGLSVLHLRKPKWKSAQVESLIESIPEEYHKRIVVHGHYHLAFKYNLKGVHLRRKHRSSKMRNKFRRLWFKLKRPSLTISCTFHSLQSLKETATQFDYVLLSSVFGEASHYSAEDSSGVNLLKNIILGSSNRVFAYGGITEDRIPVIKAAGFSGVVLSGLIWKHDNDTNVFELFAAA